MAAYVTGTKTLVLSTSARMQDKLAHCSGMNEARAAHLDHHQSIHSSVLNKAQVVGSRTASELDLAVQTLGGRHSKRVRYVRLRGRRCAPLRRRLVWFRLWPLAMHPMVRRWGWTANVLPPTCPTKHSRSLMWSGTTSSLLLVTLPVARGPAALRLHSWLVDVQLGLPPCAGHRRTGRRLQLAQAALTHIYELSPSCTHQH